MRRISHWLLLLLCFCCFSWNIALADDDDDDDKPAARADKSAAPDAGAPTARKAAMRRSPPPRRRVPPQVLKGEKLYQTLSQMAQSKSPVQKKTFAALAKVGSAVSWKKAKEQTFAGHLRVLRLDQKAKEPHQRNLYLLRKHNGDVFVLTLPKSVGQAGSPYFNLDKALKNKMSFTVKTTSMPVGGVTYHFAKLTKAPKRGMLDKLFFILIVLMLFFVMVGMGMTLTVGDFLILFRKPKGMLIGPICQFGMLPLLAFGVGHLFGFASTYPFIFLGLILVASSPGGVTSNLMTYFAKGDVALSVSLTAFSTVLSLFMTPLLLGLYGSNVPNLKVPVGAIAVQILVLVIVPLGIGMIVRHRAPNAAKRSETFFSFLGIFALLFLIIVGILNNLDKFADTERYGVAFYSSIFLVTFFGMFFGAALSRLFGVSNYQTRAIALETGLQNASLAMTFALLLQDQMGDFHSAMFFTSGIFGLWMYAAGGVMLLLLRAWFPVDLAQIEAAKAETVGLLPS